MNYEQFREALFPDGEVSDLTAAQIRQRVGKPDKQDLFDMVGIVDGDVVSMSYPVDEDVHSFVAPSNAFSLYSW